MDYATDMVIKKFFYLTVLCWFTGSCQKSVDQQQLHRSTLPPTVTSNSLYTPLQFVADATVAMCDWVDGCAVEFGSVFGDRGTCLALFEFVVRTSFFERGDISDPLLFRVDEVAAAQCLLAISTNTCSQIDAALESDACRDVIVGRLAEGFCCDDRGGCGVGMTCEATNGEGIGYCSALGGAGETCVSRPCAPELRCNLQRECVASLNLEIGELCSSTFECAAGLACQFYGDVLKCAPQPELGELCHSPELPCASGNFCIDTASSFQTRCATSQAILNQGCGSDVDCVAGTICLNHLCKHLGQLGESCDEFAGNPCAEPLKCISGLCGEYPVPQHIGDSCDPNGPSCPGLTNCVQGASGAQCLAQGQAGDACGNLGDPQCGLFLGFVCDPALQQCIPLPTLGMECQEVCHPMLSTYCDLVAASPVCRARIPEGQPCVPRADEDLFGTSCEIPSVCFGSSGSEKCTSVFDIQGVGGNCQ